MSCQKIFDVKRGDTARKFQDHLTLNGVSLDLAGGSAKCILRSRDETIVIVRPVTILQTGEDQDQTEPNVEAQPQAGDLDVAGMYDLEWQVTLASGRRLTLPQGPPGSGRAYHQIRVWDTLTPIESSSSSD
jgi:hypothetical protein